MSTATTEPVRPHARRGGRAWVYMLVVAVALAGLSLAVLPRSIGYDPQSWLIWGREIGHLDLNTRDSSAAVKPLPIFVDVVLGFAGSAAPLLWLLLARAGALLALGLAFRLAYRLGGVVAGLVATVGLAMAYQFLGYLAVEGMSEPMATAAVLAAADSHLRAHRRAALGFLVVAGLLRPEAWPVVVAYCLWLAYNGGARSRVFLPLLAIAVPAVWFLIDWFGSGQLLRSAEAATHASQGGPLLTHQPGLATLAETWRLMSGQVVVLFLLGCAAAFLSWWRSGRPGPLAWLGLGAWGWVALDAVLAQEHLATGAPRYLMPAVGLACVVAGVFVADVAGALRRRFDGARLRVLTSAVLVSGLVTVCVPRFAYNAGEISVAIDRGDVAQVLQTDLPRVVAVAGGRGAILHCGNVNTGPYQRPLMAWQLDVPMSRVITVHPGATGTVIEESGSPADPQPPWIVTTCPRGGSPAPGAVTRAARR